MAVQTTLSKTFGLRCPIFIAPLAGGPTTPELVAASSNAGALGALAGAYLNGDELDRAIQMTRKLTDKPFAVNLFTQVPKPTINPAGLQKAIEVTRHFREELSLAPPTLAPPFHPDFDQQFSVVLKSRPAVFSFTFGSLSPTQFKECQREKILTMGTVTNLKDALELESKGVDIVVAQGVESGGHRGMFHEDDDDPLIRTLELTQILVGKLRIPVVAAGGIMNGEGIATALKSGAQAAQLGTAFLACDEAGTSKPYRQALLNAQRPETQLTKAFSGRWARGLENRFMTEMKNHPNTILPFPIQNAFTRDLRVEAAKRGRGEFLSLWAGEGVNLIRTGSAASLIETLTLETQEGMWTSQS